MSSCPVFLVARSGKSCPKKSASTAPGFTPNPGVLYPAIYDLLDRVAAAAKSVRPFAQTRHEGYRCDLSGEAEWLTTDRAQLAWGKQGRKDARPCGTKRPRNCAVCCARANTWARWECSNACGRASSCANWAMSSVKTSIATSFPPTPWRSPPAGARWLDAGGANTPEAAKLLAEIRPGTQPVALPRQLAETLYQHPRC